MWLLAIKAMLGDRGKLLTTLLGAAFAFMLVNLQGGLLLGFLRKASILADNAGADIWVVHKHTVNSDMVEFIPERWIHRVRSVEGVEQTEPYVVMFGQMLMPDGRFEVVMVVGCEPATLMGNAWRMVEGDPCDIRQPDAVFIDANDRERMGNPQLGDIRQISGRRAQVLGITDNIVSFTSNPFVFTSLENARTKYGVAVPSGMCSFYLVKAKSGTDVPTLVRRIQERVPELKVHSREEQAWNSMNFWLTRTGIGMSFSMAALLGLLVGLAVVAQTLYAAVTERIKEFATLKALGADNRCVARFVLAQGLGSALLGSVLGLAASIVVGAAMSNPRSPVALTWWSATVSAMLILLVCLLATWLPYWRIRRIDPASVLRE